MADIKNDGTTCMTNTQHIHFENTRTHSLHQHSKSWQQSQTSWTMGTGGLFTTVKTYRRGVFSLMFCRAGFWDSLKAYSWTKKKKSMLNRECSSLGLKNWPIKMANKCRRDDWSLYCEVSVTGSELQCTLTDIEQHVFQNGRSKRWVWTTMGS